MVNEAQLLALTQQVREFKRSKDWDGAVRALREQKLLLGHEWTNDDLAKMLQRAGRFGEAISEIEWLLAHSRQQHETPGCLHRPESLRVSKHQLHSAKVHETAALICRREKRSDLERFHREHAAKFRALHEAGLDKANQDFHAAYVERGEPFKALMESEEYQLDREAIALRKAGDWTGAISALRRRKELLGVQFDDSKLAKYLQAAGHFEDALAEIKWLVDNSHARVNELLSHQPPTVRLVQHAIHTAQVYSAAALICKREKRPDLEAGYEALSRQYWTLRERLEPLARANQKEHFAAREARINTLQRVGARVC